jgi:hypothetical protein
VLDLAGQIGQRLLSADLTRLFDAQKSSWHVEVEDLSNRYHDPDSQELLDALSQMLSARLAVLHTISSDSDYILQHAADYRFIMPWYLARFRDGYVGKKVEVFGWLDIPDPAKPTRGVLTGYDDARTAIQVRFDQMSAKHLNFILTRHPVSWHEGTLLVSDGEVYLHFTLLLGVEP